MNNPPYYPTETGYSKSNPEHDPTWKFSRNLKGELITLGKNRDEYIIENNTNPFNKKFLRGTLKKLQDLNLDMEDVEEEVRDND